MDRSRKLISKGMRSGSRWRLGLGVALGLVGILRRATRSEPETVGRVILRPGEGLVIKARPPAPKRAKRR